MTLGLWGGMGVSFKSSFSAAKHVKRITDDKQKRLELAMNSALLEMQKRTQEGKGADGDLKEYSPAYAKFRQEKYGNTKVNLTRTGQMLQAMKSKTELNTNGILGKIFFLAQERAKAAFNQKLRPNFFKLSREQLQTIMKKLKGK